MRDLRKRKGYSDGKTAKHLNVNLKYLQALEACDYDKLPPDTYVQQILIKYCHFLEINAGTAIAKYQREKKIFDTIKKKESVNTGKINKLNSFTNKILAPGTFKYLLIGLLICLVLGYFLWEIYGIISPPNLIITHPRENYISHNPVVEITGQTEKHAEISINDQLILAEQDGTFKAEMNLQKGVNYIKITGQKKYGREKIIYKQIIYDPLEEK